MKPDMKNQQKNNFSVVVLYFVHTVSKNYPWLLCVLKMIVTKRFETQVILGTFDILPQLRSNIDKNG